LIGLSKKKKIIAGERSDSDFRIPHSAVGQPSSKTIRAKREGKKVRASVFFVESRGGRTSELKGSSGGVPGN